MTKPFWFFLVIALSLVSSGSWAQTNLPNFSDKAVIDQTNNLSSDDINSLTDKASLIASTTGYNVSALIIPNLVDETIASYSARVLNAWHPSTKEKSILFVVSMGDRKSRLELGSSLKDSTLDKNANYILVSARPFLKTKDLVGAVDSVFSASKTAVMPVVAPSTTMPAEEYVAIPDTSDSQSEITKSDPPYGLIFGVFAILVFLIIMYVWNKRIKDAKTEKQTKADADKQKESNKDIYKNQTTATSSTGVSKPIVIHNLEKDYPDLNFSSSGLQGGRGTRSFGGGGEAGMGGLNPSRNRDPIYPSYSQPAPSVVNNNSSGGDFLEGAIVGYLVGHDSNSSRSSDDSSSRSSSSSSSSEDWSSSSSSLSSSSGSSDSWSSSSSSDSSSSSYDSGSSGSSSDF